jgi:dTDP-4-dehydrorhamnose reductase
MKNDRPILIFGSSGQVGSALRARAAALGPVRALGRSDVDLHDVSRVEAIVLQTAPRCIINAAGYTAIDTAESRSQDARAINTEATSAMAAAGRRVGAAMVHFSSDYVFDGTAARPYTETDHPAPLNVYGRTKLAGDQAVELSGIPHLIFRAGWLYSARGRNLLRAVVNRAESAGSLRVVNDQVGAPTSAAALADAVIAILASLDCDPAAIAAKSGVYNLSAAGQTTWHGFATEILRRLNIHADVKAISSAESNAAARRPRYSLLDTTKVRDTFGVEMADWRDQLDDVLREFRMTV